MDGRRKYYTFDVASEPTLDVNDLRAQIIFLSSRDLSVCDESTSLLLSAILGCFPSAYRSEKLMKLRKVRDFSTILSSRPRELKFDITLDSGSVASWNTPPPFMSLDDIFRFMLMLFAPKKYALQLAVDAPPSTPLITERVLGIVRRDRESFRAIVKGIVEESTELKPYMMDAILREFGSRRRYERDIKAGGWRTTRRLRMLSKYKRYGTIGY